MKESMPLDAYMALRLWLKKTRTEKGLTLRQAAALYGRHHSIIGKIETGARRIDVVEFMEYCNAIDADFHEGLEYVQRTKTV